MTASTHFSVYESLESTHFLWRPHPFLGLYTLERITIEESPMALQGPVHTESSANELMVNYKFIIQKRSQRCSPCVKTVIIVKLLKLMYTYKQSIASLLTCRPTCISIGCLCLTILLKSSGKFTWRCINIDLHPLHKHKLQSIYIVE